jgi:hypothetical protein
VTNTCQKNTRKTSTRPGLAVPDAVTIAMGEIADDLREGLLALAVGTCRCYEPHSNAMSPNRLSVPTVMTKPRTQPDDHQAATEVPRNSGHPRRRRSRPSPRSLAQARQARSRRRSWSDTSWSRWSPLSLGRLGGRPTPTARQASGGRPPPQVPRDPGQPLDLAGVRPLALTPVRDEPLAPLREQPDRSSERQAATPRTSTAHPMTPQGCRPRGPGARPTVRPGRAVTHRARMESAADRRRAQPHRTTSGQGLSRARDDHVRRTTGVDRARFETVRPAAPVAFPAADVPLDLDEDNEKGTAGAISRAKPEEYRPLDQRSLPTLLTRD